MISHAYALAVSLLCASLWGLFILFTSAPTGRGCWAAAPVALAVFAIVYACMMHMQGRGNGRG